MDVSKIMGRTFHAANQPATKRENVLENKTTLQAKDGSGVEINISKEGRERHSTKQPKITAIDDVFEGLNISEFKAAIHGNEITRRDFAEFTDQSIEYNPSTTATPKEAYTYELRFATTSLNREVDDDFDYVGKYSSVASKYMELRKGIEEKYSGVELEEHIKWLDESYDDSIEQLASHADFDIKRMEKFANMVARINNRLVESGGYNYGLAVKDTVKYDTETLSKSLNTLSQNMQNSIKQFGALAKQYMLDGNVEPTTADEKNSFIDYISQNVDSSKGLYSLQDMDTITTILNPTGTKDMKSIRYDALAKLDDTGISNDLKAALIRVSVSNDRLFGIVPEAYKELEKGLYQSMLKWEKTAQ